ncbi:hypothetical protein RRSWK_06304 [Rhodopirellula sp. SWK7]|nr:hypothetical protein RRSWK_06304 [Rhodopirellula sp. SWK7]
MQNSSETSTLLTRRDRSFQRARGPIAGNGWKWLGLSAADRGRETHPKIVHPMITHSLEDVDAS